MNDGTIGIVGAGVAGLSAARLLQRTGRKVVVLDKGRAPGGRLATRVSRDGHRFDHGAQYIGAKSPGFASVLKGALSTKAIAEWEPHPGIERFVGTPSMVDFAGHLARAAKVIQGVEVTKVRQDAKGWMVATSDGEMSFETLVLTCPAPQAASLLADQPAFAATAAVDMIPCLTIMAAFEDGPVPGFASLRDPDAALSWVAFDSDKPGRAPGHRYVGQASEGFSRLNLEAEKPAIADMLLPDLCEAIGRSAKEVTYLAGHRWRYARVSTPLGLPFLADDARSLFVGGDWCLGARVESAWESGVAIAEAIIAS